MEQHKHNYIVIEWVWVAKTTGQYIPIKDPRNSLGMKAAKVWCPDCGNVDGIGLQA